MPELFARFVDPGQVVGGNYPLGPQGAYSVTLLVCLIGLLAAFVSYVCGRAPEGLAQYDLFGSTLELVKGQGGYRTRARSSRFGGTLSVCFFITAIAMLIEVLVQNASSDFGIERTATFPAPDTSVFTAEDARMEVSIVAQRAPGATRYACLWSDIVSSPLVGQQLQLVEGTRAGTNTTGNLTCSYRLASPSVRLLVGPYTSVVGTAALSLGLGPGLQIASWEVKIFDGSPQGRHTRAWSGAAPVPQDATRGRAHAVGVTLTPSTYTDRSYVLTSVGVDGTTYRGYRAAFTSYNTVNNTGARFLEDTLQLQLSMGPLVTATERAPRFTGLQLLGVLGGLAAAAFFFWRWAYELLDAAFDCASLTKEDGADLACLGRDYVRGGGGASSGSVVAGPFAGFGKSGQGAPQLVIAGSSRDLYALPGETIQQAAARAAILSQPMVPLHRAGNRGSLARAHSLRFGTSGRSLSPSGGSHGGSGGRAAFAASGIEAGYDDGHEPARAQAMSMGFGTAAAAGVPIDGGAAGGGGGVAGSNPYYGDNDAVAAATSRLGDTYGYDEDGAGNTVNPARLAQSVAAFRSPAIGASRNRAQVSALVDRAPADSNRSVSPSRRQLTPSYSFYHKAGMAGAR